MWRFPYQGPELRLTYERVRSDDLYRARWDGTKLSLRSRALLGEVPWASADFTVGIGRKVGRWFTLAAMSASAVTTSNLVSRTLVGGSWDELGPSALFGHPYGEFRVMRSAVGMGRLDLQLYRDWEIGARVSGLASDEGYHYGSAFSTSVVLRGFLLCAGAAMPDVRFRDTLAFATLTTAIFIP